MKIIFYSPAFKPKRASHRLRGEMIAAELTKAGYNAIATRSLENVDKDTVVVFLKFSQPDEIEAAKRLGAFTIYDLCDNKFEEQPEFGPCCLAADHVTVNSEQMGVSVLNNTGKSSTVIPDPFERPILPPKFDPKGDIRILWFGSGASLKFFPMVDIWQALERDIKNYHFTMITSKAERITNKMRERFNRGVIKNIDFNRITIIEWDWATQGDLLQTSDLVLMPVSTDNYRTDTKSANRVIDSLVSGRWVVTSPLASYLEFDEFTWQKDPMQGIKWALENPDKAVEKIRAGQQYTIEKFAPAVIAQKWAEIFNDTGRN